MCELPIMEKLSDNQQFYTLFLNPDDLEVPLEVAEKTIKKYNGNIDIRIATIQCRNGFTYIVADKNEDAYIRSGDRERSGL